MPRGVELSATTMAANLTRFNSYFATGTPDLPAGQAPFSLWWSANPQSILFEEPESFGLLRTFIVPTPTLDVTKLSIPVATLTSLHFGWDNRMEASGCIDDYNALLAGYLTACDMDRYTTTIQIWAQSANRTPFAPTPSSGRVLLHRFVIPGQEAYGGILLANPIALPVSIDVLPGMAYTIQIQIPGLYDATGLVDNLMMPSLVYGLTGTTPIVYLEDDAYPLSQVQNMPLNYTTNQPTAPTLVPPTAGQPIRADGNDGVQSNLNTIENRLLSDNRLYQSAQPGLSSGMNADGAAEPIQTGARTGWARHVVQVPLWDGWAAVRASTVGGTLPFVVGPAPFAETTGARAGLPVPDNFVVDHVLLTASWNSPPAPVVEPFYVAWGLPPTGPDFTIAVGVVLGSHGPQQTEQQVAYGVVTPAAAAAEAVHSFFGTTSTGTFELETIYELPLVGTGLNPSWSNQGTGNPVYMGRTNLEGSARTNISPLPASIAVPPLTEGRETHLWVKMTMADLVDGLGDAGRPDDIRIGEGGFILSLVGRVPVQGNAIKAGDGRRGPGIGEQGVHGGDRG
jgi:hypothetical protein